MTPHPSPCPRRLRGEQPGVQERRAAPRPGAPSLEGLGLPLDIPSGRRLGRPVSSCLQMTWVHRGVLMNGCEQAPLRGRWKTFFEMNYTWMWSEQFEADLISFGFFSGEWGVYFQESSYIFYINVLSGCTCREERPLYGDVCGRGGRRKHFV